MDEIRELALYGIIDSITTNPTLVKKSGRSFSEIIEEIFTIVDGSINLEVVSEKAEDMTKEAEGLVKKYQSNTRKT